MAALAERRPLELALPSDDPEEWAFVRQVLSEPLGSLADLDRVLTQFSSKDREPRVCRFFAAVSGSASAGAFDFDRFLGKGAPLMRAVALEMPALFEGGRPAVFGMRSSWGEPGALGRRRSK